MLSLLLPTLLGAGLLCATPPAQDPQHQVIYTTLTGWPQNDVPGMPGVHISPYAGSLWFQQVAVSPSGRHVLITPTDDWSGASYVVLVDGQTVLSELMAAPWAPGESLSRLDRSSVGINSGGTFALSCETTGGASGANEYVVSALPGGSWQVQAQEGSAVPGIVGASYTSFDSVVIDNAGAAGFRFTTSGGPSWVIGLGGIPLAQSGVDAPSGQLHGGPDTYQSFDRDFGLRISADGAHWVSQAWLNDGGNAEIVAHDNGVVVQEGYAIPGSGVGTTAWDVNTVGMDSAGRWYATGRFTGTGRDQWAMRDGALAGRSGDEIYPGGGKFWSGTWSDSMRFVTGAGAGDWYLGGVVDKPPNGWEVVVTKNGVETFLSSDDPIDMDGNGLYDDGVTLYDLTPFSQATDDGSLFLVARVHDAGQGAFGYVLMRLGPPLPELAMNNLVAGQTAELHVQYAQPGDLVVMGYSLSGAGPTVVNSPWGPLNVALSQPMVQLPPQTADQNGEATYSENLPPGAAGLTVWAHAVVVHNAAARLTNAVSGQVQ